MCKHKGVANFEKLDVIKHLVVTEINGYYQEGYIRRKPGDYVRNSEVSELVMPSI